MSIRLRLAIVAALVGGLAACASIVGLDHTTNGANSDPTSDASSRDLTDGGTVTGSGVITLDGGVTVSPTTIDMANVKCGETKTAPITIVNPGASPVPYEISIPSSDTFTLDGAGDGGVVQVQGDIPANGSKVVNLIGVGDAPTNDNVDVVISIGGAVAQINATIERHGPLLTISPPAIDFGDVRASIGGPSTPVAITNNGNAAVTIQSFSGLTADFSGSTNLLINPGATVNPAFTFPPGATGDPLLETLTPQLDIPHCGATPTLTLSGHRVDTNITVTPASLDFGKLDCGSTPTATKDITLTNYSNQAVKYAAKLAPGSKLKITSSGNGAGTVPLTNDDTQPTSNVITLQPLAVGTTPGTMTETVQVTLTPLPPATPTTENVAVTWTVYGAYFTIDETYPGNGGFSFITDLDRMSYALEGRGLITNKGNAPVCVTYSLSGGDSSKFRVEPDDVFVAAGANDLVVNWGSSGLSCDTNYQTTVVTTPVACSDSPLPAICKPTPIVTVKGNTGHCGG